MSPVLKNSDAGKDVKIMAFDDNRGDAFQASKQLYGDLEKSKAIDGIATHWYDDGYFNNLTAVHLFRPDKFILASEVGAKYRLKLMKK